MTTTTLATLLGVIAAFLSGVLFGTSPATAGNTQALVLLGVFVVVQFPIHRLLGIDVDDYGPKDYLYIAFMTFTLWFITYTILLTAGVSLPSVV
ncbi:MAG TPA: hypothetical protein RMF84_03920 [Polyangiaceae bacterium LLY-WYZ-14_1]|nr:hypothetical protein [Polyangiaceae bacterium LLY-WYZ-14_1]